MIKTQGIETPAFILGLLTAGGGITGYVRTGSIPSVTAGVTVGALVSWSFHTNLICPNRGTVRLGRPPHSEQPGIWCRISTPRLHYPRRFIHSKSYQDPEAASRGSERAGSLWPVRLRQCVQTCIVGVAARGVTMIHSVCERLIMSSFDMFRESSCAFARA